MANEIVDDQLAKALKRIAALEQKNETLEQKTETLEQALQENLQLTQESTLLEFLQACHEHLRKPICVETKKTWTTLDITNPSGKFYPKRLTPWEDFPQKLEGEFLKVQKIFHPPEQPALRLFRSIQYIKTVALDNRIAAPIANEQSLRFLEKVTLENHVALIIDNLRDLPQGQDQFQLGHGIFFENDPNSLSEKADDVQERQEIENPKTPPRKANPDSNVKPKRRQDRADQYCIYKGEDSNRELLFIAEYKPPHKLTIGDLNGFRPMDLKKEVIDRTHIPLPIPKEHKDAEADSIRDRLQYNADKVAVAVATQTFHYMIENGLKYSYITSGQAMIFLQIEEDDPTTLHYHVTVPSEDVEEDGPKFLYQKTAIFQVVALCLMAFQSQRRDQEWRQDAMSKLTKFPSATDITLDFEDTPEKERKLGANRKRSLTSLSYKGRKEVTSNFVLRSGCKPVDAPKQPDDEDDDDDAPGRSTKPSVSGSQNSKGKSGSKQQNKGGKSSTQGTQGTQGTRQQNSGGDSSKKASSTRSTPKQYCTQKCLLGIVRGSQLDETCPNASFHPRVGKKHAVNRSKFLTLIRKQLSDDLDENCEPLGLQGSRGALFKITLASHGYVFVGKGTVNVFVPDLVHEGKVYQQLAKLQGKAVPVYLGNIDLDKWYYLDVGVRILHMLLMSWGGNLADKDEAVKDMPELPKRIQQTVAEVQQAGINQMDVRPQNLLWNREAQRVMLIDFERAVVIKSRPKDSSMPKERAVREVSSNKKSDSVDAQK